MYAFWGFVKHPVVYADIETCFRACEFLKKKTEAETAIDVENQNKNRRKGGFYTYFQAYKGEVR